MKQSVGRLTRSRSCLAQPEEAQKENEVPMDTSTPGPVVKQGKENAAKLARQQSYKSPTDSMVSPISRNLLSRKLSRPGSIKLPIKVLESSYENGATGPR